MLIVKPSINIRNSTKKSSDWLSVDATFSSMTDFHMEYRIWIESVFQGQGVENKKSSTYCRKSVRYEWKTKKKQNVYLLWDPLYTLTTTLLDAHNITLRANINIKIHIIK